MYQHETQIESASFVITTAEITSTYNSAAYCEIYNAAFYFPTGGTVTIDIYDPVTAGAVALDDDACVEMGATGIFIWDTSKLTTQPDGYQEYIFKMTNGTLDGVGVINMCKLTTEEHNKLMAVATAAESAAELIDGTITRAEKERLELAEMLGHGLVPAGAGTYAFKAQNGTTTRIGGTVDADGVRTVTTINGSP